MLKRQRWARFQTNGTFLALLLSATACSSPGGHAETAYIPESAIKPINNGLCPDLSGKYQIFGMRFDNSPPNNWPPQPASYAPPPPTYFRKAASLANHMRVSRSTNEQIILEAIDAQGVVLETDARGAAGGWYCSNYRLVRYTTDTISGEGVGGTSYYVTLMYKDAMGRFCSLSEQYMRQRVLFYTMDTRKNSSVGACYFPIP